jgi:glycosyltransferase involved in cell wall biosynthesis
VSRIVHVTEEVDYVWGGLTYAVSRFCYEQRKRGCDIELVCLTDQPTRPDHPFITCFRRSRIPALKQVGSCPPMRQLLARSVEGGAVNVFHVHGMWRMPHIYPTVLGMRHGIPVVVAPHGSLGPAALKCGSRLKAPFWKLYQRPAFERASCFHATAESEAEDIRRLGIRKPIAVIPNGVDMILDLPDAPKDPPTVLCLGRIHPIKALDNMLKAWSAVEQRFPHWRLRIVGPDQDGHLAELQRLAEALRIRNVSFEGPLEGEPKVRAYAQASLFAMPSKSENFGLTAAEALAASTPVIVSKGAPWSEVVERGCGWWIDHGVEPLRDALATAMSMPATTLAEMGARGRAWVIDRYGWATPTQHTLELYEWLRRGADRGEMPSFVSMGA